MSLSSPGKHPDGHLCIRFRVQYDTHFKQLSWRLLLYLYGQISRQQRRTRQSWFIRNTYKSFPSSTKFLRRVLTLRNTYGTLSCTLIPWIIRKICDTAILYTSSSPPSISTSLHQLSNSFHAHNMTDATSTSNSLYHLNF